MPYEYKKGKDIVWNGSEPRPKLPRGLRCDGCDEKCKLSLSLQVQDQKYQPRSGTQRFVIKPIIRAGDKVLRKVHTRASVKDFPNEIVVRFGCGNAKWYYQKALLWCRKNCKHSKLR